MGIATQHCDVTFTATVRTMDEEGAPFGPRPRSVAAVCGVNPLGL